MYAKQALWEAVRALASDDGSIQERLALAAGAQHGQGLSKIAFHVDEQLPEEHRAEFRAIWDTLHRNNASPQEVTQKLTNEECRELAQRIVDLYTGIMGGL